MVLDSETLQPLHPLTEKGKERYQDYLTYKADMILLRNIHPMMYFIMKVSGLLKLNDLHDRIYDRYFHD